MKGVEAGFVGGNFILRRRQLRAAATAAEKGKGGKGGKSGKGDKQHAPPGVRQKKSSTSEGYLRALEKYEPVIGIEVHVQLNTNTKAFCSCSTRESRVPNTNVCPVCMGHPGTLPVLNRSVVELAAKAGMALRCNVAEVSKFDRKNYFYPDTPKNYQISQYDVPLAEHGSLDLPLSKTRVGVTRLHIEEDAGKLTHMGSGTGRIADSTHSLVDYNRAGTPLVEIVSEPDIRSSTQAAEYGQELQKVLRYVGASNCNMQDGSLRLDVNVSIREKGAAEFGTKIELKNLNSFGSVQRAIEYEIERQAAALDAGEQLHMETRFWDEKGLKTLLMRVKEGAADYRYFPEPDIPPLVLQKSILGRWIDELPELPTARRRKYAEEYGLSDYDAAQMTDSRETSDFFQLTVDLGGSPKSTANLLMGEITKALKDAGSTITTCKLEPPSLASLVKMQDAGVISTRAVKELLPELVRDGGDPEEIVEQRGLKMITDPAEVDKLVELVLEAEKDMVEQYKAGKTKLLGALRGKLIKRSEGKMDPQTLGERLMEKLGS
mmetsp:Transcript_597/g.2004  ORF Transcript_597/g.2004 Transcript_597/m.2004 type:complete len:547 (+) Transcript_597:113-1753(+)|eukprot:CAMPEP_0198736444 /NCGR_PEP_ID=MMETSP1475-20131203/65750_1 /TAXON_ID= ORGANISM="Unidentified sp., Strain CCMP1999" /NCGR_SAMPLE_ID=MMETSP1475 /ASSEMBLY_ACC=CAM_ASM_001111 /LENGTH=546 /DNA_ID=CAMNT_0044500255 /DNA_START=104 /DNA_END=1744 /DNA_ORIENTATION=+